MHIYIYYILYMHIYYIYTRVATFKVVTQYILCEHIYSYQIYTLRPPLRCWSLLCFQMTSFNYGAKGVRDVNLAFRFHQSNIMPHSIFFSNNIVQCVTCLFVFCFVLFYMCIKEWFSGFILFVETLSYNWLRQIGLISFKWGSKSGVLSVVSKQWISFGVSSVVYGILLLSQGWCGFSQYNLQDRMLWLNYNPTLYWGG